jgi:beta-lactam-binding protein with PASTA domain/tRNA A-37 threonylcarbamoyl transferase component Bud32
MVSVNTTDPLIGRLVDGRYEVRSRIARGGMATVYLAKDLRLERRVAIKVMHGHLADDSTFRERFIQEARSAARLAHPNVVNVFDQGQDTDMAYLVMEYLPGITLRELLAERRTLTSEQAFDILEAVLSGLAAAHKAGIVHRDLKPENVLLADDGRIKIGDFGLARAASANTATGAALLGTIAYLSPELVTRGIADTRSDIYAVGIMLFEMLTGQQPFRGEQPMQIAYQHANDSVPVPSSTNPRVLAEFDELVLWATARDPEDRPRDAREMLDQVLAIRESLRTPTATTVLPQRTAVLQPAAFEGSDDETQVLGPRFRATTETVENATATLAVRAEQRRRRGWWLIAAVALVVGLVGGTGWYFGTGPGSLVTIPHDGVVGESVDAARALLSELSLVVDETPLEVFDPFVAAGLVAGTNPAVGEAVAKESPVVILVSKGPEPVTVPELVGVDDETAKQRIAEGRLIYDPEASFQQFDDSVPVGIVIAATGLDSEGATIALENGGGYFDQRPVGLIVSLGPLPSVSGLTYDEAVAALDAVGVIGIEGSRTFDDSIPLDRVIRSEPQVAGAPVRPGDTVLIVISKGVDLVDIPDIIGESLNQAKKLLEAAGFSVKIDAKGIPKGFYDVAVVESYSPGQDIGAAKRGATITIKSKNYD